MSGTWTSLTNQPTFAVNAMLLLTDGTVMCQELASANWWKLSPDSTGSYVNGTWSARASGPNGPTYYRVAKTDELRYYSVFRDSRDGELVLLITDLEHCTN